jgi:hypothetical protein
MTRDLNNQVGSRPIPDPTLLTTQQTLREIEGLKELIFTRLGGVDKSLELLEYKINEGPHVASKLVESLRALIDQKFEVTLEKFRSIQTQFTERDTRVEQTARDSKVAIDAALSAQEKAVSKQNESFGLSIAKSETATAKQIDQLGVLVASTNKGTDDKITDLKERIARIESLKTGADSQQSTQRTAAMNTVSIVALVIGSLIGVTGIVVALVTHLSVSH